MRWWPIFWQKNREVAAPVQTPCRNPVAAFERGRFVADGQGPQGFGFAHAQVGTFLVVEVGQVQHGFAEVVGDAVVLEFQVGHMDLTALTEAVTDPDSAAEKPAPG
jgi:hypothetical protein